MNDEISMEERDEAILHMFAAGKNVDFVSDKLGVPVGIVADMQKQWMKGELVMPSESVEMSKKERNKLIVSYRENGKTLKWIATEMDLPYHVVSSTIQRNKKAEVEEPIKPLREKDIPVVITGGVYTPSINTVKAPEQAITGVSEDKATNTSWTENDSLKAQINDLNRQLARFREGEKNIRAEMIQQKSSYEKQVTANRREIEKAYADYSLEVENVKRLRKQVEDLLMVDGLNVGLMQQNLMFRERFEMLQEGETL